MITDGLNPFTVLLFLGSVLAAVALTVTYVFARITKRERIARISLLFRCEPQSRAHSRRGKTHLRGGLSPRVLRCRRKIRDSPERPGASRRHGESAVR